MQVKFNMFIRTINLYVILFPGPILFSLSIQYEGIPRPSAITWRLDVLLEFHPPTTKIRSIFSSTNLYTASCRSCKNETKIISLKFTEHNRMVHNLQIN